MRGTLDSRYDDLHRGRVCALASGSEQRPKEMIEDAPEVELRLTLIRMTQL